jgi:hypothetical protein
MGALSNDREGVNQSEPFFKHMWVLLKQRERITQLFHLQPSARDFPTKTVCLNGPGCHRPELNQVLGCYARSMPVQRHPCDYPARECVLGSLRVNAPQKDVGIEQVIHFP